MKKILKNTTTSDIILNSLGIKIPSTNQIEISVQNYGLLASDTSILEITPYINSGDIIINNGINDFESAVGLEHIANPAGVVKEHSDVTLLPFVSDFAPAIVKISDASIGQQMMVNEEIFGQTRIDNLVDDGVEIQLHFAIDNSTTDRWVQFQMSYITSSGSGDKNMDTLDGTLTFGPIEVPTTPFQIFKATVTIPTGGFSSGEHYIFLGFKRVIATGKTAPDNDPIILRYCKIFYKQLES